MERMRPNRSTSVRSLAILVDELGWSTRICIARNEGENNTGFNVRVFQTGDKITDNGMRRRKMFRKPTDIIEPLF